jgi:hypothetical protein
MGLIANGTDSQIRYPDDEIQGNLAMSPAYLHMSVLAGEVQCQLLVCDCCCPPRHQAPARVSPMLEQDIYHLAVSAVSREMQRRPFCGHERVSVCLLRPVNSVPHPSL